MLIKSLSMKNFRVYDHVALSFGEHTNILFGENGAGKTTVLEAIHTLAYTRSFKTFLDNDLLRYGTGEARVKGNFVKATKHAIRVETILSESRPKQIKINGAPLTNQAELIGRIPVVCLAPEDGVITTGSPVNRRQFFDKLFSQIDSTYLDALQHYNRTLKQRNAHLNNYAGENYVVDNSLLDALDEQLAQYGAVLQDDRTKYFKVYTSLVYDLYPKLEPNKSFKMTYVPSIRSDQPAATREAILRQLIANRPADLRRGTTTCGTQRDLYLFYLNRRELRKYGSMGEHKLVLVALKFAEGRFLENHLQERPIYLLDDLFSELDVQRSTQIMQSLDPGYQIFITSTDLADLRRHGLTLESDKLTVFDTGKLRDVAA